MLFLTIDIGNTRSKAAVFDEHGASGPIWSCETEKLPAHLEAWLQPYDAHTQLMVGWISTANMMIKHDWPVWQKFTKPPYIEEIRATDKQLPIRVAYQTPQTLGADRLVAAIAACSYFPDKPVLVIDVGTAITYDCVDASGSYLGGGISPGIRMRFRALEAFTARLPLVEPEPEVPLIGNSTESSIRVGAQRGAIAEVSHMTEAYRELFGDDLKIFLTGGDAGTFEKHLKKTNFARFHLLLEGIYLILKYRLQSI